jgi:hypothetical protein
MSLQINVSISTRKSCNFVTLEYVDSTQNVWEKWRPSSTEFFHPLPCYLSQFSRLSLISLSDVGSLQCADSAPPLSDLQNLMLWD